MNLPDLRGVLSPAVIEVGLLIGIVRNVADGTSQASKTVLNQCWFEDPLKELRKIPADSERRDQLFKAINEVAPGPDGWHDLLERTLFLVRKDDTLVGLGVRRKEIFSQATAAVSLFVPLFDLKSGMPSPTEPMTLQLSVASPGKGVLQSLAVSASLSFQGTASVAVTAQVLRRGKLVTLSLTELLNQPEKLVDLLTGLLVDQVGQRYPSAAQLLQRINSLLGVGDYGVFKGSAFFIDLVSGPDEMFRQWLSAVADLLGCGALTGAGDQRDPYLLLLYPFGMVGGVYLALGRSDTHLHVGMQMKTDVSTLAPGIGVQLGVDLGLVRFQRADLRPDFSVPALSFDVTLTNPASSRLRPCPLFDYVPMHWVADAPQEPLTIGSLHCGLRIAPGEKFDLARLLFLRVENVSTGGDDEHPFTCDLLHDEKKAIALLEYLGKTLQAQYAQSRFNKSSAQVPERSLGESIEDGFALSNYNAVFDRFAAFAATDGIDGSIAGVTRALTAMAKWLAEGEIDKRLPLWLELQIRNGRVFEAAGSLLSLGSHAFYGIDGKLVLRVADDVEFALGAAQNSLGLQLSLMAGYRMDAVKFRFEGMLGIALSGASPDVGLAVTLEPGDGALWVLERAGLRGKPALKMSLTPKGATGAFTFGFPADELTVQLLPTLAWKRKEKLLAAEAWLLVLGTRVLSGILEEKVLNHTSVLEVLDKDLGLGIVPGVVLTELKVLSKTGPRYCLGSLSGISANGVLNALLKAGRAEPPEGDGVWLLSRSDGTASVFLRREMKSEGKILALGRWLEGETGAENWLGSGRKPGAELILGKRTEGSFDFQPGIELVSVGVDMAGAKGQALFSVRGVELQKVKARIHLKLGAGSSPVLGGALELNEFSMPLGPKVDGPGKNPVAANLLGDGAKNDAEKSAKNPAFSAVFSYVDEFKAKVTGNVVPAADGTTWVPLNRSFGPMRVRKLGLGLKDKKLKIGYDGAVSLSSLNIELDRLTVGIPLTDPTNVERIELDLAGLAFSLASGPVQITGGLFKAGGASQPVRYDGLALIKAQNFTVSGFGSYAMTAGAPSLFVYAALYQDIGGPSWFHVTGLAAGFGYNRALQLPPVEKVHEFPLVRAAMDERYIQGSGQAAVGAAMAQLATYIPPSRGQYWLAIGVRFTSFEIIKSFALLSVAFGGEVEIGLLGMSTMTLPKRTGPDDKTPIVAYIEMALRAVIRPSEGSIAVEGRLTDSSYVLDKNCKLTGGFAFFAWFSGVHAGDFVVTVGGYHPRFQRPEHYPIVPRLALNWKVDDHLTISGEEYFALTPSCLMLGGKLRAVYLSGSIQAWFTAYADILLSWQPFYYVVEMGVAIGVACNLRISLGFVSFTLSLRVELSVSLMLCGPPFSGEVRVDLSVISFTIRFGEAPQPPAVLTQAQFVAAFLPVQKSAPLKTGRLQAEPVKLVPDTITAQITGGLLYERSGNNGTPLRIVNAHEFSAVLQSVVPSRHFTSPHWAQKREGAQCGIRPMGVEQLNSEFAVSVQCGAAELAAADAQWLNFELIERGVPAALWGKGEPGKAPPPGEPGADMIKATMGVRMYCTAPEPTHSVVPILIEKLLSEQLEDKVVRWRYRSPTQGPIPDKQGVTLDNTIWGNQEVDARRKKILEALAAISPSAMNTTQLERMQQKVLDQSYFQEQPRFTYLGETLH